MDDNQPIRRARAVIVTIAGVSYFLGYGAPHDEHHQFPVLPALQAELAETTAGSSTTTAHAQAPLTAPSSGGGTVISVPAAHVQVTAHAPTILVGGVPVDGPAAPSASTERSA